MRGGFSAAAAGGWNVYGSAGGVNGVEWSGARGEASAVGEVEGREV